ncbi:MAG: hypothetical protein IJH82_03600 [Lachnospiraceae bacterium]|nr:hypothetical protein [Lachnospiraceae bacterium]
METFFNEFLSGTDAGNELSVVRYKEYAPMPVNFREMMRYAGVYPAPYADRPDDYPEELRAEADKAIRLLEGQTSFRVGYCPMVLKWDEEGYPVLPFKQHSDNLKKNLHDCEAVVLFAATIGAGTDRLIHRYEKTEPGMGLLLQALGAERAESLCNLFCFEVKEISEKYGYTTHPRFSPGFGDLPITVQPEFLQFLDASRRLGITLTESYLMSPSKSVTAVIGIEKM